jgi:Protein of unknown function (DUF2924)
MMAEMGFGGAARGRCRRCKESSTWLSQSEAMTKSRVRIGRVLRDRKDREVEIARLRDLDLNELRARWQTIFRRKALPHLPRHLLFRILAYRLQADALGDLDSDCRRLLNRILPDVSKAPVALGRTTATLQQGTILSREWKGHMHRVAVLADGFAWNGKTYPSLSKVAFAITDTRWNGPRFFGLRDRSKAVSDGKP